MMHLWCEVNHKYGGMTREKLKERKDSGAGGRGGGSKKMKRGGRAEED